MNTRESLTDLISLLEFKLQDLDIYYENTLDSMRFTDDDLDQYLKTESAIINLIRFLEDRMCTHDRQYRDRIEEMNLEEQFNAETHWRDGDFE